MFCFNTNQAAGTINQFALKNLQVPFHTSLYADEKVLDFYFATFDRILGPFPIFKYSMLVNGYTISTPKPQNIRFGIVNYFSSASAGNTGYYFPSVIRLAGYFEQQDLESASKIISLFFMNAVPFYTQGNKVTCKYSGISQPTCRYYPSGLLGNGQSYNNYERVDIEFDSIPSGIGDLFQLLIPVSTVAGRTKMQFFLGMMQDN